MKKVLFILTVAVGITACSKTDDVADTGIVYQDENITLYTEDGVARTMTRKRKWLIRKCCEFYSPIAGRVIWCVTNNGICKPCDSICGNGVHPKGVNEL